MTRRRLLLLVLVVTASLGALALLRAAVVSALDLAEDLFEPDEPTWQPAPATGVPRPDLQDWTLLADLQGSWAFRIGDDPAWASGTDDAGWDQITVPGLWEEQGYQGYDGNAWYRRTVVLGADAAKRAASEPVYLLLGRIDDSDEAFVNGVRVGRTGQLPPVYETGFFDYRVYAVPPGLLRLDSPNTVAVRVHDGGREGGIIDGPVALATTKLPYPAGPPYVADLVGTWRFAPGDDPARARPDLDDSGWETIQVPGTWERQGYRSLDGFAWYRTTVTLTAEHADQDLLLVMGAIDDLDQAFVNGTLVGQTGDIESGTIEGDEWLVERAYPVAAKLLSPGDNVIAVRVFDGPNEGGIHRGPVALMTPQAYSQRAR